MRRNAKEASVSRISHSLTLPELLVRLFISVVCLGGIGFASVRFYSAVSLRLKQRALVASVKQKVNAVENAGDDKSVVSDRSIAGRDPSASVADASVADARGLSVTAVNSTRTPEAASPLSGRDGEGSVVATEERNADPDDGSEASEADTSSQFKSDGGSNEMLVGIDEGNREQGSISSSEPRQIDKQFQLPDFVIQDLSGEQLYDPLETHKGKVLVLDFWASWCAPCFEEMQMLQDTFREYDAKLFQLIAVNTEETRTIVQDAMETHQIKTRVALDLEGSAAAVFGVEALPTVVLIDQAGAVQRIYVGMEKGFAETIRPEVDRLLSGQKLSVSEDVASRLFLANMKRSVGETVELKVPEELLPSHETLSDIVLANGRVYSVGDHLAEAEARFDRFFADSVKSRDKSLTSLTNEKTGLPALVFSRRGEKLHGPLMSFHENGKRQSFVHYSFGKRIATQVSWDALGRPLVLQEYRNGRKDGLQAIFKSCGDECATAHLWVAEEWRQGELLATHVGLGGNEMRRNEFNSSSNAEMPSAVDAEYRLASQQFSDYDDRLTADEDKLKQAVRDHYRQLRREFHAQANARLIASSARTHSFASMLSNGNGRSSSQAGQRKMFSGSGMIKRNCGRS